MTWLTDLIEQHAEMESPTSFWRWAGLIAISAVVKDNIWLHRGSRTFRLYPNIYVIFHADSGLKKGAPIALAKDLIKETNNTRIISGRSSVQGILKKLGTAYTSPGGMVNKKSVGVIISSELSSSLVSDPAALTILTDLYDRQYNKGDWESLLKMEDFQLKEPTVSLLGGINEAHAEGFFDKKDIKGGFYARTFIVYEKEEQTVNSLVGWLKNPPNIQKLSIYLKELAKLSGPFKDLADETTNIKSEVGQFYDDWYNHFKQQVKANEVKDETGTLNRFGDSVLKVAMLLSLARAPTLEIDMASMIEAIEICEKLVGNVRRTTMGKKGISVSSNLKTLIINELLERDNHSVTRTLLKKKYWMHYASDDEFDEIMQSFDSANMIITSTIGNTIVYTMPPSQVKELNEFLAGKNIK